MNIHALVDAGPVVYLHALVALASLLLGAIQFLLKKGTTLHRVIGWCWVVLMAGVAISSFGIHEIRLIGPFSAIHLLSILVLYSLWQGVSRVRAGDIKGHQRSMMALYIYGMVITGGLTLLPGRVMHTVLFGS